MEIKKIILIIILIANTGLLQAQYTVIPSSGFEQHLIDQGIDSEGLLDGQILTSDINTVTGLYIAPETTSLLDGIEDFTALEHLSCQGNSIVNLDLSNNLNLKYLDCGSNLFSTLDLTNNTLLEYLYCNTSYALTNLNIDSCINLKTLDVEHSIDLTSINLTHNINLERLYASSCSLTSLNVSQNNSLKILECQNNSLTNITINNANLTTFYCNNNNLNTLDISNCVNIKTLTCDNNNINTLNLDSNLALEKLYCSQNNLVSLNLSNNTNLEFFGCPENNLNTLTIQNGTNNLLNGTYTIGSNTYNRFNSTNNPNLNCIFVDNAVNSTANWLDVDNTSTFVETQTACDALAIPNYTIENSVNIYPNPTQSYFKINTNATIKKIDLYNLFGKKIKTFKYQDNYMVNNIEKGIYLVLIETEKFNKTTKLIIK